MLEMAKTRVVGFIQVADAAQARDFYERVLGLTLRDDGFALIADFAGAMLRITTIPNYVAPEHPAFGFVVPDTLAAAADLTAKGVTLERYPFLGDAQGADGVWTGPDGTKVIWFKDPDGNLLTATSALQ
jgi:catechol 2,3-dioxygenase-like lactoylglutathione lyase family enzyme